MRLGWGQYLRNVVATGNIVRHAGIGCVVSVADGAGSAVIAGNLFREMQQAAIMGFRWDKPASGDLTKGSAQFPQLTIENNRLA
jgi:putative cofactor-binding repeat protein